MRKVNIRGKELQVTESQQLFWDQVESGLWEPETFDVIDHFVKPGTTFVDIGAWNGVCSIYANALGADVELVEPDPDIEPTLTANLNANCESYSLWHMAIADTSLGASLKTIGAFGDSMSSIISRSEGEHRIPVDSVTLESFFEMADIKSESVSLIKMDIEGGELLVLLQARKFLRLYKPTIYLSLHPGWFPDGKDDLRIIMEILFPIYKVCRMIDKTLVQYNQDNFLKAVDRGEHTYVLIAK